MAQFKNKEYFIVVLELYPHNHADIYWNLIYTKKQLQRKVTLKKNLLAQFFLVQQSKLKMKYGFTQKKVKINKFLFGNNIIKFLRWDMREKYKSDMDEYIKLVEESQ